MEPKTKKPKSKKVDVALKGVGRTGLKIAESIPLVGQGIGILQMLVLEPTSDGRFLV